MKEPKENVLVSWSGGKDSALCLHKLLESQTHEVKYLLTTISQPYQRVSMHGIRLDLLEAQTQAIGIPLLKLFLPETPSMEKYEQAMREMLTPLKHEGIEMCAFGDIHLDDLRIYREAKLSELGMKALFPLWKKPTPLVIQEFMALGFKTIVTCVHEKYLDKSFVGRVIDEDFLKDLPRNVDPCGENGEFHTFVFDAPFFKNPISFQKGGIVYKKYNSTSQNTTSDQKESPFDYGFWFIDLLVGE